MTIEKSEWKDTFLHLLAMAARLEGEGQYNLAKLSRAAADSISRRAAYQLVIPKDKVKLVADIKQTVDALSSLNVDENLLVALKRGAAAMSEGRLPLIKETPHAYVCRTCGHLAVDEPAEKCPTCGAWPSTYQRFLPVYWLDALEPLAALKKLRQTPKEVAALLEGLSEHVMKQQPEEDGWAIRNVVSHL